MYDTYLIKEGDTIDIIASKYNTTKDKIYELNGYILDFIPGRTLVVPKENNNYFDYYKIKKGDTLYSIAKKNNTDPDLIAKLNGIKVDDYIYPDEILLIPKPGEILYITAVGDTLNEVIKGFKVNINELMNQNKKIYLQSDQLIIYKK